MILPIFTILLTLIAAEIALFAIWRQGDPLSIPTCTQHKCVRIVFKTSFTMRSLIFFNRSNFFRFFYCFLAAARRTTGRSARIECPNLPANRGDRGFELPEAAPAGRPAETFAAQKKNHAGPP